MKFTQDRPAIPEGSEYFADQLVLAPFAGVFRATVIVTPLCVTVLAKPRKGHIKTLTSKAKIRAAAWEIRPFIEAYWRWDKGIFIFPRAAVIRLR